MKITKNMGMVCVYSILTSMLFLTSIGCPADFWKTTTSPSANPSTKPTTSSSTKPTEDTNQKETILKQCTSICSNDSKCVSLCEDDVQNCVGNNSLSYCISKATTKYAAIDTETGTGILFPQAPADFYKLYK